MKIKKAIMPLFLVLCLLLSGCGRKKKEEKAEVMTPKRVLSQRIEEDEEEEKAKVIIYKVILQDKALSLFEVDGENKKLITSIEINPDFYPDEDISKLKSGIDAYCMEDGYEILENFAN